MHLFFLKNRFVKYTLLFILFFIFGFLFIEKADAGWKFSFGFGGFGGWAFDYDLSSNEHVFGSSYTFPIGSSYWTEYYDFTNAPVKIIPGGVSGSWFPTSSGGYCSVYAYPGICTDAYGWFNIKRGSPFGAGAFALFRKDNAEPFAIKLMSQGYTVGYWETYFGLINADNYGFNDTYNLIPGHTYTYYIYITNGTHTLATGPQMDIRGKSQTFTYNPTPPPAFTSASASGACSGTNPYVQLSWQASNSNGTYSIYLNGAWITNVFGGGGSSYFDYGVADALGYTYTLYTSGPGGGPAVANTYVSTPLCKPPPSPPTINLQLGKNSINLGESTYLYWQISNATLYYLNGMGPRYDLSNALSTAPSDNTAYSFTAYNGPDQWGRWSAPASNSITLVVNKPPPSVSLSASPNPITAGTCSTLYWAFYNATYVTSNFGIVRSYATPSSESGTTTACPGSSTTYQMWAYGSGQQTTNYATVYVYPAPSVSLTASPNPITFGSCATLNWSYSNATSVSSNFNVVRNWNPPQSESGTVNACPNTTTTYNIQASSYTGPGAAQSVTVTVVRPTLNVSPSAWNINLPQGSNASQLFLVTTSLGNYPWTVSANQPWISFDKTSGSTPSSFTATANVSSFPLGTYNANITVLAPATSNSPVVIPVTINVTGISRIIGDIFAQGRISGLSVDPRSVVVSQSGQIVVSGTTYTIPNYNFATALNWSLAKVQMEQNVSRLKATKAAIYRPQGTDNVVIDGTAKPAFNLNPDPAFGSDPFSNPNIDPNSPDGGVFWVKGNLTLRNTQFKAKGTIIVDGNLIVEGDTSYSAATASSSLGIIALGNINIRPSVNNLIGAYFTPNNLVVESGSNNLFTFNGLLIGGASLALNRESFTISYDPRITSFPPPGFSQFYLPIFREATP